MTSKRRHPTRRVNAHSPKPSSIVNARQKSGPSLENLGRHLREVDEHVSDEVAHVAGLLRHGRQTLAP